MERTNRQLTNPTGSRNAAMPASGRAWSLGFSSGEPRGVVLADATRRLHAVGAGRTVQDAHLPRSVREVALGLVALVATLMPVVTQCEEPAARLPHNIFQGEWRTARGAVPDIVIGFHGREHDVSVNGRAVTMEGGVLSAPSIQKFFSFQTVNMVGPHGGESYRAIGLIAGVVGSDDVLSGFYTELDCDSEGREVRSLTAPIVLRRALEKPQPSRPKKPQPQTK